MSMEYYRRSKVSRDLRAFENLCLMASVYYRAQSRVS